MSNARQRRKTKREPLKQVWLTKHREGLQQAKPKVAELLKAIYNKRVQ